MDNTVTLKLQFDVAPSNVNAILTQIHNTLGGLGVNVSNLNANLDNSKSSLATFDDFATKIGFRLQGIKSIFDALSGTFGAWIADSNRSEASTAKLTRALQNQGIYSEALVADIKKYAEERKNLTGIDEDETIAIAAQLTAMNLQGEQLKKAITLTQDLSTLMDGDMQGAVRIIADAFNGNTSMLGRYVKGLDEADIKSRGMVSIMEQLTKAFGGQAEAVGSTNEGAMKKYRAALEDLQKSFGAILMESLRPIIDVLRSFLSILNEMPTPLKTVALGITALGIVYGFLNTQFGATPYVVTGIITLLLTFYQAIKDGNPLLVVGAGLITALTAALILFRTNGLITTIASLLGINLPLVASITNVNALNFSFLGLNATLTITQILTGGIFLALGVLAAVLFSGYEATKKTNEQWKEISKNAEAVRLGLKNLDEEFRTMSTDDLNKKLDQARKSLADYQAQLGELQRQRNAQSVGGFTWLRDLMGLNNDQNRDAAELQGRIDKDQEILKQGETEEEERAKTHQKIITQLEIDERKMRANLIQDETKKQIAMEDANYREELIKIKDRQRTEHLTQQQVDQLNELTEQQHQANLKAIREQAALEKRKFNLEQQVKDADRVKDTMALELDNQEKIGLATAKTDADKEKIENDFAKRRVELEANAAVLIMQLNGKVLAAEIAATHDPEKIRELREQLKQLDADIKATQANASLKTQAVDLGQGVKDAERQKELDAENAQYLAEKDIEEKRRWEKKQSEDYFAQVNDSYIDNLARLNAAETKQFMDEKKYLSETDADKRRVLKAILDEDKQEVNSLQDKMDARQKATEADMLAGAQAYDAHQSFAQQEKKVILDSIRSIIAQAVITQIAKVIKMIPWPFNLVVAPAAGLAVEALLEAAIPKFAAGGGVTGEDGVDRVPAMLTAGEYVVRKDIAQRNYNFLEAMNRGLVMPRFAGGGAVYAGPSGSSSNAVLGSLKKEFADLKRAISKMKFETNIQSNFDIQKYDKAEKRLTRARAAYTL